MPEIRTLSADPVSVESASLGEGPRWDARRQEFLWLDLLGGVARRTKVGAGGALTTLVSYDFGQPVGAVTPLLGESGYLAASGAGFTLCSVEGELTPLVQPEADATEPTRFNDAACDPAGRFWAGTMAYAETPGVGRLWRCDPDGSVALVRTGFTIANGLAWTPEGDTLFHNDSGAGTITRYAVHDDGSLGAPSVILDVSAEGGAPDGLTIDAEGMLWASMFGGGEVRRYTQGGRLIGRVTVPVSQPTAPCLGGSAGTTLFITTATTGLSDEQREREPDAGRVFAVEVDVPGRPADAYAGALPTRLA